MKKPPVRPIFVFYLVAILWVLIAFAIGIVISNHFWGGIIFSLFVLVVLSQTTRNQKEKIGLFLIPTLLFLWLFNPRSGEYMSTITEDSSGKDGGNPDIPTAVVVSIFGFIFGLPLIIFLLIKYLGQ